MSLDGVGGNLLIVANHISWLDIFVLLSVQPVRFVAKAELKRWPVVGPLITGAGTLYVERARRRDTHNVNRRAAEALARGDVLAIFPEGTTTDGTTLLPFHGSLLQPIVDAEGHVLPVAIRYRTPDGAHTARRRLRRRHEHPGIVLAADRRARAGGRDARRGAAAGARFGHRRELSRAAEARHPNGFGVTGDVPGTWYTRRSASLIAVSAPPHRQPESSISRLGASLSSSVDQCPHTTVTPADARCGCVNHGR